MDFTATGFYSYSVTQSFIILTASRQSSVNLSNSPLFSVIVPVYNRCDLICGTLATVESQTFRDFELILVDDGSCDGSVAAARALGVRVIEQSNLGPGSARNRGVRESAGEYIAFLDSDDAWFPWTLAYYADVIEQHHRPAFVTGTPVCFGNDDELQPLQNQPRKLRAFDDYFSTGEEWLWHGVSSFVIRRDVFLEVGGFAEGRVNGEDAELAMRLGTAKGFVHIAEPPMFGYRVHDGNVTLDRVKSKQGLELLVRGERESRFPGGRERVKERATIISRHVRPFAISSAKEGDWRTAFQMYRAIFAEAFWSMRLRFLFGLPMLALVGWMRRLIGGRPD